jgi:hypothetical protein
MKFWEKEYVIGYICIFSVIYGGSTITSIYVKNVWKGLNIVCAVKEILLMFMLWNYMQWDAVAFRIGLDLP